MTRTERANSIKKSHIDGRMSDRPEKIDSKRSPKTDQTRSGDAEQAIGIFPAGSHVTRAVAKVNGLAFEGKLQHLKGVKVTESPVAYGRDGKPSPSTGQQAFIVDFGGIRPILMLEILDGRGNITLILPWMGAEFSLRPLYPPPAATGAFSPVPDAGTAAVGLAGVETMKLLVQIAAGGSLGENNFSEHCRIATAVYPSNVTASIGGRPPFWTYPKVLDRPVEVTGLADELNAFLKESRSSEAVDLHFASETPGVLLPDFVPSRDIDSVLTADARWGDRSKLDVVIQPLERKEVILSFPATGTRPWAVNRMQIDLTARFPLWQAVPDPATDTPGGLGLKIDAHFSIARRFVFGEAGELHGFSLPLQPPAGTMQLRLEVSAEKAGQPDPEQSVAVAESALTAGIETGGAGPFWHEVLFAKPVRVGANEPLWLTAKVKAGSVETVGIAEAAPTAALTLYNDEGGRWQRYPQIEGKFPVAQIRILRRPFARETTPLLDLLWEADGETARQSLDLSGEAGRVEMTLQAGASGRYPVIDGTVQIPVTVRARTGGTVVISTATAFYRETE